MSELATFTAEARDSTWVVAVGGELDLSNVAELSAALESAAAHGAVVLDLSELAYLDSSAVEALIVRARRGAPVRVVCPPGSIVRRTLEILGLEQVMPLTDSLDQALAA